MKIVIIGLGAQTKYALENFSFYEDVEIVGLIDLNQEKKGNETTFCGVPILGGIGMLPDLHRENISNVLICSPDPEKKSRLIAEIKEQCLKLVNAIHPRATIAGTAVIGKGNIINAGAVIQPYAQIGNGVMIHANVVVEHDNIIEDCVNLAPGVTLAGWVKVKQKATVFTGSKVIPTVVIGQRSIVGAGSVVLKDVPDRVVVAGVPGRVIRKNKVNCS